MANTGESRGTVEVDKLYLRETFYPDGAVRVAATELDSYGKVREIQVETTGSATGLKLVTGWSGPGRRRKQDFIELSGDTVDLVTLLRDIANKIEASGRRPAEEDARV